MPLQTLSACRADWNENAESAIRAKLSTWTELGEPVGFSPQRPKLCSPSGAVASVGREAYLTCQETQTAAASHNVAQTSSGSVFIEIPFYLSYDNKGTISPIARTRRIRERAMG